MNQYELNKRLISNFPHQAGFFSRGEFVYDPEAPWDALRKGVVSERDGRWVVCLEPVSLGGDWLVEPIETYAGALGRHILIDCAGVGFPRRSALDPTPWLAIYEALLNRLRYAERRRVRLETLLIELKLVPELDPDLIEDTMRMFSTMGAGNVWRDAGGLWFGMSELLKKGAERRDYLSSFSDELLTKSRRIDNLISHTGTVGSYREQLLRTLIRQILPTRYDVSTGFIENSPRQLDVLVWDAAQYAPLFREQDVVVVPAASVRAIIEVKTTLNTASLDEALDILYEVMCTEQPLLPVFKGIFGFESDYASDLSIAGRIQAFFQGKHADGILQRRYRYVGQGISAVCVPNKHYVYQRYRTPDLATAFPYPVLKSLEPEGRGDVRTGVLLGELLSYLDLEQAPKRTLLKMFLPIFDECQTRVVNELFGPDWQPTIAAAHLGATLQSEGAREYVRRTESFRSGAITASEVWHDLMSKNTRSPEPSTSGHDTMASSGPASSETGQAE